ncbi:MAG: hypothetical protein INR64_18005 [Caulobacteraceae bacterium]|nr:hypothetical protein [Caulobacter sp.]
MTEAGAEAPPPTKRRRGFGLDSPLPADRRVILRAVLRHLAEERPAVVALTLSGSGGTPDLMLLAPKGRSLFVTIKPQAEDLTRAHRTFADLCRAAAVPLVVVRSLPEARQAFDRLGL